MKILKNKTYNDLMLRLQKSESDLKKQIEKTDAIQLEFNDEIENYATKLVDEEMRNIKIQANLDDQTDYISSLNERVQKAESALSVLQETHSNVLNECERLYSENSKLESKLSRKGTGKKGSKKENFFIIEQPIDESQITKVEFEEFIDISEVNTLTDYIGYEFIATDKNDNKTKGIICEDKTFSECIVAFEKIDGFHGWTISQYDKTIPEKYHSSGFRALYIKHNDYYFKTFKIIKK